MCFFAGVISNLPFCKTREKFSSDRMWFRCCGFHCVENWVKMVHKVNQVRQVQEVELFHRFRGRRVKCSHMQERCCQDPFVPHWHPHCTLALAMAGVNKPKTTRTLLCYSLDNKCWETSWGCSTCVPNLILGFNYSPITILNIFL